MSPAIAALVNSLFINVQANMVTGARLINMDIFFTNRKLRSIHSESVPRSRLKASTYSSSIEMRVLEHFLAHKTHDSRHQITQIVLNG